MVSLPLKRCSQGRSKTAADWSDLLPEIVNNIAREISVYEDLQAFMGVCDSWRIAVIQDKTFIPPLASRLPSLLLAESKVKEEQDDREIFLLSGGMIGRLYLPEARNQRIVSSHGWLMTAAEDEIQAKLIHPHSHVQIDLPKLSTLPDYSWEGLLWNRTLRKVLFTCSDPSDPFFRVLVLHGGHQRLGICKPGDDSWTPIDTGLEAGKYVYDIIYHHARKRFYGSGIAGAIVEGDFDLSGSGSPLVMRKIYDNDYDSLLQPESGGPYLVEWDDNSLLVVTRVFEIEKFPNERLFVVVDSDDDEEEEEEEEEDDEKEEEVGEFNEDVVEFDEDGEEEEEDPHNSPLIHQDYETVAFFVHRFTPDDGKMVEVDDLGGRALFLGYNSSFAMDASRDGTTIRGNCIYFTDDCYLLHSEAGGGGGKDIGVYDYMKDEVERIPNLPEVSLCLLSPPLWLAPSVN